MANSSLSQSPSGVLRAVDSIKQRIPGAEGKLRYDLVYAAAYELFDVDNHEAVTFAEEAHRLSIQLADSLEITKSGRLFGQLLRRTDQPERAIAVFIQILPVAERNDYVDEEKRILNALALSYNFKAMYDKALAYSFKSLEIREREGDAKEIRIALNNIGLVYYKMEGFAQALQYYQRALDSSPTDNPTYALDQIMINIALCHVHTEDYELAKQFASESLRQCGSDCSLQIKMQGQYCLGLARMQTKQFAEAETHFLESLELAKEVNDKRFQAENSLYLGTIYLERDEVELAKAMFVETEKISLGSGYSQILIYTYARYSRLYEALHDFENTALYQSRYIHLKDSVYSDELIRNLARVQTEYAERENIKTIAEQDEILRLNQIVIERQRQVYFFVVLVAALSVMITYVFLRYSRALTKAKMLLSQANQTLERRVEDRTKALQNVNNELDNFIYKTSHDIRGPLASLKGIANVALLELVDPKAQDYLHKLDASADKLNTILTRLLIVNQINHAVLTPVKIDFPELLQEILTFERKKGIPARLSIRPEIGEGVVLFTDRHVLRIILENLIDNAIKYYNSSDRVEPFVKIRVGANHDGVKIDVVDNGIGIKEHDPQKLFQMFVRASERSESGGIGLYLTKLAAERLYAKVDFSTTPDSHTQFTVTLPGDLRSIIVEKEKEVV